MDKYIGKFICDVLGRFKRSTKKSKFKNILVVQVWGIGETILILPAIKALRNKYRNAKISILATKRNSAVFYNDKDIDDLIVLNLDPFSIIYYIYKNYKKYDLVVDMEEYLNISAIISFFVGKFIVGFSHDSRSKLFDELVVFNDKQHMMHSFLDLTRAVGPNYKSDNLIKLNYSDEDKGDVEEFLKYKVHKKDYLIGIAPGASESARARMWPWKRYVLLCNKILENRRNKIIFIGDLKEKELIKKIHDELREFNRAINTAGFFDLNSLFYLIEKCDFFISNDTGPMHIAAAQGVKTLGLFGPNLPVRFGPYGKGNLTIYKGDNCQFSPCINVHKGQVPDCLFAKKSKDYQKCMKNIKVEDVVEKIGRLI